MGGRAYVDTGPVLERELATARGAGVAGEEHACSSSPRRGSYFFLGVVLLDVELAYDEPFARDHCGTCTAASTPAPPARCSAATRAGAPVMDATPLHLLPHHRAEGRDPARAAAADRQPHLRLRHLPGGLPAQLPEVRADHQRGGVLAAGGRARRASHRVDGDDAGGVQPPLQELAGQARQAAGVVEECGGGARQLGLGRKQCRCWSRHFPTTSRSCAGTRRGRSAGSGPRERCRRCGEGSTSRRMIGYGKSSSLRSSPDGRLRQNRGASGAVRSITTADIRFARFISGIGSMTMSRVRQAGDAWTRFFFAVGDETGATCLPRSHRPRSPLQWLTSS